MYTDPGSVSHNFDILIPPLVRHESDDGPYYWHIKSGTIQLEPPEGTVRRPKPPPPPHPASLTPGKVAEKNLKNKEKEVRCTMGQN